MESGQERMTISQLKADLKKVKNKPALFEIDTNGSFLIKDKAGDVVKTIPVGPYRPPTKEELNALEEKRAADISKADDAYEEAAKDLREAYEEYKAQRLPASKVLQANLTLMVEDMQRNEARYGLREVEAKKGLDIKKVILSEKYEERKMPFPVYMTKTRPHTLQAQYSRLGYVRTDEEAVAEEEGAEVAAAPAAPAAIIAFGGADKNEYGFLSPDFPAEFTVRGVKYYTVDQMLAAEKARTYGNDTVRIKIMSTRSVPTMRMYAEMLDKAAAPAAKGTAVAEAALAAAKERPGAAEWRVARPKVMADATYAKFKQNPALAEKLLTTGNDYLVYAAGKGNTIDGIGLDIGVPEVAEEARWRGENKLGQLLMNVRGQLRTETDEEAMQGGAGTEVVEEETISDAAYKEKLAASARMGAIIAAKRAAGRR